MSVRDLEDCMLKLCVDVAQGRVKILNSSTDANAVSVLAMFLSDSTHLTCKQNLQRASFEYFVNHKSEKLGLKEVSQESWCLGLPRFKEMFVKCLQFDVMQLKKRDTQLEECV